MSVGRKARPFCILLSLVVLLFVVPVSASGAEDRAISKETAELVAGICGQYLNSCYGEGKGQEQTYSMSEEARGSIEKRAEAMLSMEARIGAVFDTVQTVISIKSVEYSSESNRTVSAEIYAVTTIEYHYPGDNAANDVAAYGVWHTIELSESEGQWIILHDSFDERDVTGLVSEDRQGLTGECIPMDSEIASPVSYQTDSSRTYRPLTYTTASVNAAIQYAVTYCGIDATLRRGYGTEYYSGSAGGNTSCYNPSYTHKNNNGGDCANFVSQCLYAAGFPVDSIWMPYQYAWVGAWDLSDYLINTCQYAYHSNVSSNYSTVFPGNPVYWDRTFAEPSYHMMICVGYNSAGIPVLCAHTTDVYRMPITNYTSNHKLYTIKIAASNLHTTHLSSSGYYYNPSKHYHICTKCELRLSQAAHTVSGGHCTVCGSTGPFLYD